MPSPARFCTKLRSGELAHFGVIPQTPYYGTADATILYLILLHETWQWQGDNALLRTYRDLALRCLDWIDLYGDRDGDGFQEYQTRSSKGYENMGWKDADDAVVYPDGSQVKGPKALCELQGYVFDAWLRMAEVFDVLGEPERAAALRRKAADLRARFEARFWCEEIGSYAYALDAEKRPVRTIASNAGHCLWNGIASDEHAQRVVERLLEADMWSGWGIRTLSAQNPAYNPFSYQRGSVWPHDNGIIALGFASATATSPRPPASPATSRRRRAASRATACLSSMRAVRVSRARKRHSRCSTWGPTSHRHGPQAASFICCRRFWGYTPTRQTAGYTWTRICPTGCPTSRYGACVSARQLSRYASGAKASGRAGRRWTSRVI